MIGVAVVQESFDGGFDSALPKQVQRHVANGFERQQFALAFAIFPQGVSPTFEAQLGLTWALETFMHDP